MQYKKNISRTCFIFMIAFTFYDKRAILMLVRVAPTLGKPIKPKATWRVFKLDY